MAKDKISDYSSTANSNTDIAGINIDEGCAPSGINDAIRTLMAQLKTWQSGGQDVYIHPAGSASAPSITANGDTNTGIFFPAADTVGITTGGTERLRIDSAGDVGIGITPSAWYSQSKSLQVGTVGLFQRASAGNEVYMALNTFYDSTNTAKYVQNGGASRIGMIDNVIYFENAASGTAGATASFSERMRLDASGNLGIGVTSMSYPLDVKLSNNQFILAREGASNITNGFRIGGPNNEAKAVFSANSSTGEVNLGAINTNYFLTFSTNGANERARIDSSGNLLVGDTSAVGKIYSYVNSSTLPAIHARQDGTAYIQSWVIAAGAMRAYIKTDGGLGNYSANNVNLSDERMKTDISLAGSYLAKICAIPVKTFKYKDQTDNALNLGVIAQDVEAIAPELVDTTGWGSETEQPEDGVPLKAIYQTDLQYALMKSIQELKAIVDAQAVEIAALKG